MFLHMKSLFKDVNILHWRMKYGALPNITRPGHFLTSQGLNHYSILNSKSTPGACPRCFGKVLIHQFSRCTALIYVNKLF